MTLDSPANQDNNLQYKDYIKYGSLKDWKYRFSIFISCGVLECTAAIIACSALFLVLKCSNAIKLRSIDYLYLVVLPALAFLFIWALYVFALYPREVTSNMLMSGYSFVEGALYQVVIAKLEETKTFDENKNIFDIEEENRISKINKEFNINSSKTIGEFTQDECRNSFKKEHKIDRKPDDQQKLEDLIVSCFRDVKNESIINNNDDDNKYNGLDQDQKNIIDKNIIPFLKYLSGYDFFTAKRSTNSSKLYYEIRRRVILCKNKDGTFDSEKVIKYFDVERITKIQKALFKDSKEYAKYFNEKIQTDNHRVRKSAAETSPKGSTGKNLLNGGQILKYAAKAMRYVVASVFPGTIAIFLARTTKMLIDEDKLTSKIFHHEHWRELFSISGQYILSFIFTITFFCLLYGFFSKNLNTQTAKHGQQIFINQFSDAEVIFQPKARIVAQMDNLVDIVESRNSADLLNNNDDSKREISIGMVNICLTLFKPLEMKVQERQMLY